MRRVSIERRRRFDRHQLRRRHGGDFIRSIHQLRWNLTGWGGGGGGRSHDSFIRPISHRFRRSIQFRRRNNVGAADPTRRNLSTPAPSAGGKRKQTNKQTNKQTKKPTRRTTPMETTNQNETILRREKWRRNLNLIMEGYRTPPRIFLLLLL